MKKLLIGVMTVLLSASMISAAVNNKWLFMSFPLDRERGFKELAGHCKTHDMDLQDLLWANQLESEDITAGTVIYLPVNKAELLAVWQYVGVRQPKTSASAATADKPEQQVNTPDSQPINEVKASAPKNNNKQQETPASVIAKTAKPDKVLTAKSKTPQQEIPGLADSVLVLSPNGDANNAHMRLVISGDKVEVVKLPPSAAPKKPTMSDANAPFTSGYSYLSFYNAPGKPRTRNNLMTNLNSLNGKMMWPVDGRISSPFGKWRGRHKHEGIDIPMPGGTPIRAARNGVVVRTGNNSTIGFRGYGNFVMLDHGGGVRTFYAHCSRVAVIPGQRIMQGQVIAYVGNTGRSTANHLHFEVRINDKKVNPVPYLAGNAQLASRK